MRDYPDRELLQRRPWALLAAGIIFACSLVGANLAGRFAADADIERLKVVWPFFVRLDPSDRGFLASLAMTCRLHRQSPDRAEIIACLRSASANPDALPSTASSQSVAENLERLLGYAPEGVSGT